MRYTDEQLLDRVESNAEGFTGWKQGLYLICVRSEADVMDAFDDKGYLFECHLDGTIPKFVMAIKLTTNAGSYGLKQFSKYNSLGCAVLKSDIIVYDSHKYGRHKKIKAYRQAKGFPYFRDNDRDNKAEQIGKEYTDIIFANIHPAARNKTTTKIYNWSVACVVFAVYSEWEKFFAYMNKRSLSLCILNEFTPQKTAKRNGMELSDNGVDFVIANEGMEQTVYRDTAGKLTVGIGHLVSPSENLKLGDRLSYDQCLELFEQDKKDTENAINDLVEVKLNQNQFDALFSFVFNFGRTKFNSSTLLKKLNQGDYVGASAEFPRWNKETIDGVKRENRGLTARRAREKDLFLLNIPSKPIKIEIEPTTATLPVDNQTDLPTDSDLSAELPDTSAQTQITYEEEQETEDGKRSVEVTKETPKGEHPSDARFKVEDLKPLVFRWWKRIWGGFGVLNGVTVPASLTASANNPEYAPYFLSAGAIFLIITFIVVLVVSVGLAVMLYRNRKELKDYFHHWIDTQVDPDKFNYDIDVVTK